MSKYFTMLEKFGFFFAFVIIELYNISSIVGSRMNMIYLNDMPTTLYVNTWMVYWEELYSLQVTQSPEQNLKSTDSMSRVYEQHNTRYL